MKKQINIEGMSCEHCVKHVGNALKELEGVTEVVVDLKTNNAVIELTEEIADTVIKEAIDDAGYEVVSIQNL